MTEKNTPFVLQEMPVQKPLSMKMTWRGVYLRSVCLSSASLALAVLRISANSCAA